MNARSFRWRPERRFCAATGLSVLILCLAGCRGRTSERDAREGLKALEAGRHKQAVRRLTQAIRRDPDSASLHYNLGTAYWRKGRIEPAMEAFSLALKHDPADREAWLFKGHLLLRQNRWEEARQAFVSAIHHGGTNPHALTALALAETYLGNIATSREYLEEALKLDSDYGPAQYNLASLHRDALRQPEEAIELFSAFYRQAEDPLYRDKAHAAILRLQARVASSEPADPPVETPDPAAPSLEEILSLADRHFASRRWEEAAKHYRLALEKAPRHVEAWLRLGRTLRSAGALEEAGEAFRRAAGLQPANTEPLYMLAVVLRERGRSNEALETVNQVLRLDADYALAYLLMAYLRFDEGNYRAARGHLIRYIELSPPGANRRQAEEWLATLPPS